MKKTTAVWGIIASVVLLGVCIFILRVNFIAGIIALFVPIFLLVLFINLLVRSAMSGKKPTER